MHAPSPLQSLPKLRHDRWTLLDTLINRWHPPRADPAGFTLDDIRNAERSLDVAIPTALAEWYCTSGKRRDVWSRQDEFLPPDRLYVNNNALIFYVENQGVVKWGTPTVDLATDDPPVVVESVDNSDVWIPQSDNLSKFAIYMFAYTLAFTDGDSWIYGFAKPPLVAGIVSRFPLLDFPTTWWTQTRLFGYDDLVVAIDGTDHVHACATSQTALRTFSEQVMNDTFEMYASSES